MHPYWVVRGGEGVGTGLTRFKTDGIPVRGMQLYFSDVKIHVGLGAASTLIYVLFLQMGEWTAIRPSAFQLDKVEIIQSTAADLLKVQSRALSRRVCKE